MSNEFLDPTQALLNLRRDAVDYTARDFDSIKESLLNHIKIKYPDTYKDFNASSFGSLMFDLVAYVGDQLAFYTDYIAGESMLMTAQEQDSVEDAAAENGAEPALTSTVQSLSFLYVHVPANDDESSFNGDYLRNAIISSETFSALTNNGATFSLTEDVSLFDSIVDFTNTEVAEIDGSRVKFFIAKVPINVISGQQSQITVEVGNPTRTPRIPLEIPNLASIVSVFDSNGRQYFQVPSPSTDHIMLPIQDPSSTSTQSPSIMKHTPTPRRFTFERRRGNNYLVFGNQSEIDIKQNKVADPSDVVFNNNSMTFDPTKLVSSDKFGVAPHNTILTVTYRFNDRNNVNVAVGALNQVTSLGIQFNEEQTLDPKILAFIRQNARIHNEEPINGDITVPTTEELKLRAKAAFASQGRAVTLQDYKSAVYSMPPTYGKIKRCNVFRDNNDYRRNLNLYVIAEGADGKFEKANNQLLKNCKRFLNEHRMISDSVDIFHAKIVNIGIEFDIMTAPGVRQDSLLSPIREMLFRHLATIPPEIGEHFYLSRVASLIQNHRGVSSVKNVRLVSKTGEGYNADLYDIEGNLMGADRFLYIPHDHVWEIKKASDIVMKRTQPRMK